MDSMLARSKAWLSRRVRTRGGRYAAGTTSPDIANTQHVSTTSTNLASTEHASTTSIDLISTDIASTEHVSTFQYTPLPDRPGEIRLLVILPSEDRSGPLACRIITASLDDDPTTEYEAISYVWGDPTPCIALHLDGRELLVPSSSDEVLRRVALPEEERVVWIDAICINQADLEERSNQVAFMGNIFSRAVAVLVYLGDSDEFTERALDNIVALNREIDEDIGPDIDITRGERAHRTFNASIRTKVDTTALKAFYSRSWFRRVWVVQEFAVADRVQALLGIHAFDMRVVLRVAFWLRHWHTKDIGGLARPLSTVYRIWVAHVDYQLKNGMSLEGALRLSRRRETLDPRDKVFAMLGLLRPDSNHPRIFPDHAKPVEHVFRDAVRQSIVEARHLFELQYVSHRDETELQESRYCSWTPRLDRVYDRALDPGILVGHDNFFGSPSSARRLADRAEHPDILTIRGCIMGRVMEIVDVHKLYNDAAALQQVKDAIAEWESDKHNLARTLIQGRPVNMLMLSTIETSISAYHDWSGHLQAGLKVPSLRKVMSTAEIDESAKRARLYGHTVDIRCKHRRLGITDGKTLGLFPKLSLPGDIVVIVHGAYCPLVLRPQGRHYVLLGECYLDGYMRSQEHGEGIHRYLFLREGEEFDLR